MRERRRNREILKRAYLLSQELFLRSAGIFINKSEIAANNDRPKIIIYGLRRLGDMVISIPALEAIRKRFGNAFIVLAATEYNKGIAEGRYADEVILQPSGSSGRNLFIANLKSYRFDIGIDFTCDRDLFPAYAIYRSRAGIRVGYDVAGRGIFYTRPLPPAFKAKHAVELIMNLASAACGTPAGISGAIPRYEPGAEEMAYAKAYLAARNIKSPLLGVHPGAYYPSQIWPPGNFAAAIETLKNSGVIENAVIFGGPRDEPLVRLIMGLTKSAAPLAIMNEPVGRLAAFVKLCDVFLCNNSGPLHLAAAMGVPTVSTMGPTDYYFWRPLGSKNLVIRKDNDCSPCNLPACEKHECMLRISVEEVVEAVSKQLA